jgi:tripartite ATP-independent transporter DctP family solute receptor
LFINRRNLLKIGGIGAAAAFAGVNGSVRAAGPQNLQIGYIMADNDPADLAAKKFKQIIEEKSGGALTATLHGNSLLGGERSLWEGMQIGSVDIAITGVGPISFFTPQYAGVQMYYAIRDYDRMDAVFNGPIGEEIRNALLKAKGGRVLDWWYRGARNVTANKPIRQPADLKGLKLRTPEGKIYLEAWKALGASPTPMALGELFNALQQGVVDAQENPLELIATQHYNEVQSHVSLTQHQLVPYLFAIREQTLKGLGEDQQKIVREAAIEAGKYEKDLVRQGEDDYKKKLAEAGMKVVEDVDRDAFVKIMESTAAKLENEGLWMKGLYQRILQA